MNRVVTTTGNLLGALLALSVAAVGYLTDVGLKALVVRALVSGVSCALLFRLFGFAVVSALRSRFAEERVATAPAPSEGASETR